MVILKSLGFVFYIMFLRLLSAVLFAGHEWVLLIGLGLYFIVFAFAQHLKSLPDERTLRAQHKLARLHHRS